MSDNNPYEAPEAVLFSEDQYDASYEPTVFSWHGRIGRLRYLAYSWGVMALVGGVGGGASALLIPLLVKGGMGSLGGMSMVIALGLLVYLPIVVAAFAFAKRRLNDVDQSGWLGLLLLLPFVNILFGLYLTFAPGSPRGNRYGPRPEGNSTGVVVASVIFLVLPVAFIGIAAAVALPAYQSYLLKSGKAPAPLEQYQVKP